MSNLDAAIYLRYQSAPSRSSQMIPYLPIPRTAFHHTTRRWRRALIEFPLINKVHYTSSQTREGIITGIILRFLAGVCKYLVEMTQLQREDICGGARGCTVTPSRQCTERGQRIRYNEVRSSRPGQCSERGQRIRYNEVRSSRLTYVRKD